MNTANTRIHTSTRLLALSLLICCGIFFFYLLYANGYDWDFFYTLNEVDMRAWLLDGTPPLWSYQFCGGVTRAGDPQSFGLSPLFVFVLILGPFWGTKALVFFCFLLGIVFTKKTILLLQKLRSDPPSKPTSADHFVGYTVAILFVMSNAFLWHFASGHVAYSLLYLGIGIIYFTLKGWTQTWRLRDWLPASLLAYSYYSAGFYISQVFFLLPFFIAMTFVLLFQLAKLIKRKESLVPWLLSAWKMVGFHLLGLLLASYKLYYIFHYQNRFPRIKNSYEEINFSHFLLSPLLPTWEHHFLGFWRRAGVKGVWIWEYSFFHLAGWGLLAYFIYRWRCPHKQRDVEKTDANEDSPKRHQTKQKWVLFFVIYAFVLFSFSLGNSSSWSFHSILNQYVFHQSLRVISRYQIGFVFLLHLLFGWMLLRHLDFQRFFLRILVWPILLLMLLNIGTFLPDTQAKDFRTFAKYDSQATRKQKMRTMRLAWPYRKMKFYTLARSNMFHLASKGIGNPYCYNAIYVDKRLYKSLLRDGPKVKERRGQYLFIRRKKNFSLIDTYTTPVPASCVKGSYFTQSRIVLDPSCPRRICLHVSQMNIYRTTEFKFDPKRQRYCRQ